VVLVLLVDLVVVVAVVVGHSILVRKLGHKQLDIQQRKR
jgi:hypothetical protein